jgi:hypothetical protein
MHGLACSKCGSEALVKMISRKKVSGLDRAWLYNVFLHIMHTKKEKRLYERIPLPDVRGTVEISETMKAVTVVNASTEGVCIAGVLVEVGSVVRLEIDLPQDEGNISLYCKVAWATEEDEQEKLSGLSFLNTNKILFKKDLITYNKLLSFVQDQLNAKL